MRLVQYDLEKVNNNGSFCYKLISCVSSLAYPAPTSMTVHMRTMANLIVLCFSMSLPAAEPPTASEIAENTHITTATIHTEHGDIHVQLFPKTAPITVANFAKLARGGFYEGLTFHRVEPGFVIQGGDPVTRAGAPATGLPPGAGGAGYRIPAEVGPANPEKHTPGTLAMADSGLNTASSQFYLTMAATPFLDGRYTVFGRIVSPADLAIIRQVLPNERFSVAIDKNTDDKNTNKVTNK